ncbi:MAG TPA: TlpA disulfide reductase family protein [Chitinophagaceae bacterium]|nr:TlpA disulfide reductase family protein [Chitinophagaceae bacterium]
MTSKLISLAVILLLCAGSTVHAQTVKKVKIGELAEYIRKSDHPLVVNFWATWCAPCIEEIPYFQKEVKKYAAQNVELLLVSLDFAEAYPKQIASFIKKKSFEATHFWLDETNADYFCPQVDAKWSGSIPSTLFINNKTGHRKFFERQLTEQQFEIEIGELVK